MIKMLTYYYKVYSRKCFIIKEFFISIVENYSGLGIFVLLFLEYVGFPVPGETSMSVLGFMSAQNIGYSFITNLLFATTGTFFGYTFAYFIGYKYGDKFLLRHQKFFHINEEKLDSLSKYFNKYRITLIIFSRYVLGIRHIVPYLCGIGKIKLSVFLIYNLFGSLIWCATFLGLGYFVGEKWELVESLIKTYTIILLFVAVFAYLVIRYFNKFSKIIFVITVPLIIFIILIRNLIEQELSVFDNRIYGFVSYFISDNMTNFMVFVSFLGSWPVLVGIAIISVFALWKNKNFSFYGKMIAVNLAATYLLNITFKAIFQRERPDVHQLVEISGFSFPSGHAMTSISFYGLILYILFVNTKGNIKYFLALLFILQIILIGISRVYLGVHYPSDVLAGFSAGLTWLVIFITLIEKINPVKMKKNNP